MNRLRTRTCPSGGDGTSTVTSEKFSADGKPVGRVTSAARDPEHGVVALAYVRREVSPDQILTWDGGAARQIGPDTSGPYEPT